MAKLLCSLSFTARSGGGIFVPLKSVIKTRFFHISYQFNMKHRFLMSLLFALAAFVGMAQTVSFTSTSIEVVAPGAATRTFYDLDAVFLSYKSGTLTIIDAATGTQIFKGDTSEVSVNAANIWTAKRTKLARWYQTATHTNGHTYYVPRRDVSYLYRTTGNSVRVLGANKRTLIETHIDSVVVSGVSGASAKLNWLRGQAFLEGLRNARGLPEGLTVAAGAAAGSSPTVSVVGSATNFTVTLTTGSSTTSTGVLFTVTLPVTYPTSAVAVYSAADPDAGGHIARTFVTTTANTVVLNATGTALTAGGTEYVFNFTAGGY